MRLMSYFVLFTLATLAAVFGYQSSQTDRAASKSEIEQVLGSTLQRPVFQCGTGTDAVTADGMPGTVSLFESGPVRPIALSTDGQRLYVTNRPAHCLEIYAVSGDTLTLASTVAVGLEPVAIAERNGNEVWVVNHLSDSVSVVRLDGTPRVLRTLQVGDEPRDIVFAGPNRDRAFITAAWRGQNRPGADSTSLLKNGQGRADVWVFDAANLDESTNGNPLTILTLFADTPRALAVSPDGKTVYAASHFSGNGTTTLHRDAVINRKPAPTTSADGTLAPDTGLIVKFDGAVWRDEAKTDWSAAVKFSLPDNDLFAISASAAIPVVTQQVSGVGTTLFNMAVHPQSGKVYVSNTEARNHIRFEGPGNRASTVRGNVAESRVSVVDVSAKNVDAVHLNSHVNFGLAQGQAISVTDKARSLSQPTTLVFSPNGNTLYVAALGSNKIAALPTASVASASFSADSSQHINVADGPAGLAINADGSRLFVYSHTAHRVSIVNTATKAVVNSTLLFTPDSVQVKSGRRFLYDATLTSSNGTTACSSCHTFADLDHLAWDLGNPDDAPKANPNAYVSNSPKTTPRFHPMKGPMTTQTLRGMTGNGPTHWRGDRTGTSRQTVNGKLESLEAASFKEFNPAFVGLVGRQTPLSDTEMQAFTDFALALKMPPNPVRALDNSLSANESVGRNIYINNNNMTLLGSCNHCHTLSPTTGQFGTGGLMSFEGFRITENFKVPQLRNMYQKLGMFGFSGNTGEPNRGPQIRGFGYSNDGGIDTLANFFSDPVFNFPAPAATTRDQVAAFTLAMDSDFLPIVGQQMTWRPGASTSDETRLTLLKQQARITAPRAACDLLVRATVAGAAHSGLMQSDGRWQMRTGNILDDTALRALASANQPLTFTCLPPGEGKRVALNGGPVASGAVVEYYFAPVDQYFITANPAHIALLDSTPAAGWSRTGEWFKQGGTAPVCRFYGSESPGPNSHFYTAIPSECDLLKSLQASTPATQQRLNYEGLDFVTTPTVNGACPAETIPVYRAYNNGVTRNRDGNHRFTTNLSGINDVVARGWTNEGIVFCAPPK
jgi:DNA-binding beta-propeller fold protein YncE